MKSKSVGHSKKSDEKKKKAKKLPKKVKSALQKKKPTLKQLLSGKMDTKEYEIKGAKFKKVANGLSPEKCAAIEFCGAPEGHVLDSLAAGSSIPMSFLVKEGFSVKGYSPDMAKGFVLLRSFLRGEELKEGANEKTVRPLPAPDSSSDGKMEVLTQANPSPALSLETIAMVGVIADSQELAKPVPVKSDSKESDKKTADKKKHPDIGVLKARKNGDFEFEGVKLFAKEVPNHKRVDVFVLFVPDSHPDYESLKKIEKKMVYLSTFIATKYERYPREKLLSHLADKADSLEALWRLVRRALGVTAPRGSAELKKVA